MYIPMIHLLVPALLSSQVYGLNLIQNGDFEAGPKGFDTSYRHSESIFDPGTFSVTVNPRNQHRTAASIRDHSGKGGAMLACNGSQEKGVVVWQTTLKVQPRTTYTFAGWATSWSTDPSSGESRDISPAMLRLFVNGKLTGANYGVNAKSGSWSQFTYDWNSGYQTTVTIRLVDAITDAMGNDFAIDDLSFVAKPRVSSDGGG
jgi:hypothetical protein